MSRTKSAARAEMVRVLRAIRTTPGDARERRTALLRDLAEAIVDLREHYVTPEGRPDWSGRTRQYRDEVGQIYDEAGYNGAQARQIQKLVRYHVANRLRELLPAEELVDIGLRPETPRERQTEIRARQAALLATLAPEDEEDHLGAIRESLAALARVRVRHLPAEAHATARRALQAIRDRADALLRALG